MSWLRFNSLINISLAVLFLSPFKEKNYRNEKWLATAAITPVKFVCQTSKSRNRLCFPIGCCNREEFLEVHTLLKESGKRVETSQKRLIFATSLHLRPWQTRTHCCGHIVDDTNVSPFACTGNICCGHKFCVRDTKNVSDFVQKHFFVSATNVSQFAQPKRHHEQQCVRNNVFSFARAFSCRNAYQIIGRGLRFCRKTRKLNGYFV